MFLPEWNGPARCDLSPVVSDSLLPRPLRRVDMLKPIRPNSRYRVTVVGPDNRQLRPFCRDRHASNANGCSSSLESADTIPPCGETPTPHPKWCTVKHPTSASGPDGSPLPPGAREGQSPTSHLTLLLSSLLCLHVSTSPCLFSRSTRSLHRLVGPLAKTCA